MQGKNYFISPVRDIVFKTMWLRGNQDVKKYLERMVEYSLGRKLEEYTLGANETGIISFTSIANKVDILLVSTNGEEKINVEMNRIGDSRGEKSIEKILNKSDIYLSIFASSFYDQKSIKERYETTIKVEQINFNVFHCKENKLISRLDFEFVDKNYNITRNGIKSHHLYLPRLKELCYTEENKDILKDFAMLLSASYKEMEYYAKGNKEREEVVKFLKRLGGDEEFMAVIDREEFNKIMFDTELEEATEKAYDEGYNEAYNEAYDEAYDEAYGEGFDAGIEQSAYNLYKDGISKEIIINSLNITNEKLDEIIANNENE